MVRNRTVPAPARSGAVQDHRRSAAMGRQRVAGAAGRLGPLALQRPVDLPSRRPPGRPIPAESTSLHDGQLLVDAADRNPGAVAGDVATLELIRDRVRHTLHPATATRLDTQLRDLGDAAGNKDLAAAAKAAPALLATLATI